ncbi:MAG: 4a-hydroxytetrahydrobiopterin dehydratase [Armatimonadota bacterium]|nr:4a-hydroxytetrahydrobiopterin dehydratase [Armatimonadota bacterium]
MELVEQKCEPCRAGTPALSREEAEELLEEVPMWTLKDDSIEREFRFNDFREAIGFVNKVAEIAEAEDHHPDIHIHYNKVRLELSTHKIGGLSNNDFILAAKIDKVAGKTTIVG